MKLKILKSNSLEGLEEQFNAFASVKGVNVDLTRYNFETFPSDGVSSYEHILLVFYYEVNYDE